MPNNKFPEMLAVNTDTKEIYIGTEYQMREIQKTFANNSIWLFTRESSEYWELLAIYCKRIAIPIKH